MGISTLKMVCPLLDFNKLNFPLCACNTRKAFDNPKPVPLPMASYGAKFVLTPREKGMKGAIEQAKKLVEENKNLSLMEKINESKSSEERLIFELE